MLLVLQGRNRRRLAAAATCAVSLGLSGCGSLGADASLSAAQVRFVEVSPGAPDMDFYVNGTGAAYGVGFESFTSYLPVTPGAASLSVNRTGMSQALASAQGVLAGGHQYTAIVSHGLGRLQERIYADQQTPAPAGESAIRVLNEVEGVGTLTVYISPSHGSTSPTAVLNVATGVGGEYLNLPANGTYTVTATMTERGLSFPVASVTLKPGSGEVRSVVFAGTAQATGRTNVVGFSLVDVEAQ